MTTLIRRNRRRFLQDIAVLGLFALCTIGVISNQKKIGEFSVDLLYFLGGASVGSLSVTSIIMGKKFLAANRANDYLCRQESCRYLETNIDGTQTPALSPVDLWSMDEVAMASILNDQERNFVHLLPVETK